MKAIYETRGNQQVNIHYVNAGVPGVVEENFEEFYLGPGDFSFEEVLQDQEPLFLSLQESSKNERGKASESMDSNPDHVQSGGHMRIVKFEGESSQAGNVESQLALDEALAISLQQFENLHVTETVNREVNSAVNREVSSAVNREVNSAGNAEVNSAGSSASVVRQDNIDPDNMTYEQLQSLGESVGTESRGLSDELISYLPSSKYKTGIFSRKDKNESCVICISTYKNRDRLITLPCQHQYHSKCVTKWLKQNKACPICNEEVFGS